MTLKPLYFVSVIALLWREPETLWSSVEPGSQHSWSPKQRRGFPRKRRGTMSCSCVRRAWDKPHGQDKADVQSQHNRTPSRDFLVAALFALLVHVLTL